VNPVLPLPSAWTINIRPVPTVEVLAAVASDGAGCWSHPDIPWERDLRPPEGHPVFNFVGLELAITKPDLTKKIKTVSGWWRSPPTPLGVHPDGDGWVLVSIHDSEDGPVAWWLRPLRSEVAP
jgi:hypothetical protein